MLIDTRTLPDGSRIQADIVIIGSGAAGLTLAHEFAGTTASICILESGGEEVSSAVNTLSAGTARLCGPDGSIVQCDDYMTESRERSFGGTLNVWGGKCAELDPIDFEQRDWMDGSGWPFDKAELQPFYARSCALLGIATFDSRLRDGTSPVRLNGERKFVTALRTFSDLTGKLSGEKFHRFKHAVAGQDGVSVYLYATAIGIEATAAGDAVSHVVIGTLEGKRHSVCGKLVVLAAGGLENPRLLLHANTGWPGARLNPHDQVGRHFAGHGIIRSVGAPGDRPAVVEFSPGMSKRFGLYLDKDLTAVQGLFTLSRAWQRREGLSGFSVTLEPIVVEHGREYSPVYFSLEQRPNPHSRLTLTDHRDRFGLRRLDLDWRFDAADKDTLVRAIREFAAELEQSGIGRLHAEFGAMRFAESLEAARHHIGTTRMHTDPRRGVVDAHGRVHGIGNLYVAGASVFPTAGLANPTLTIMALAMRLAAEFKQQLRGRSAVATRREWMVPAG